MKTSGILSFLSLIIVGACLISALPTLFNGIDPQPYNFQNIYGRDVKIFGSGTYGNDSLFSAFGFIAQDMVVIFLAIPLLLLCLRSYVKKVKAAAPALMAVLGFFLYAYISLSFAASYNRFFLVYVLVFSSSFYALSILAKEVHLPYVLVKRLPGKAAGIYLIASGIITFFIWGFPLILEGFGEEVLKHLFHYTTLVTHALDLALIVPASIIAGLLILQKNPTGYKIAFPLFGIIIFLLPVILLSTYLQYSHGVVFTPAEIVGPVSGFLILGLVGLWILVKIITQIYKAQFNS